MNKKRIAGRVAAVAVGTVMAFGSLGFFTGCKKENDKLVIMSEAVDGLFSPFFATSGPDMEILGMTQLSMLTTDSAGRLAYGEDEATVVLDYKKEFAPASTAHPDGVTTHYFVLKNGLKFSDGQPLTMNDVLFNMYVYLDPVYTGSTTMYSTDIVGLQAYRTQRTLSGSSDDSISTQANTRAQNRINELANLYSEESRKVENGTSEYTSLNKDAMTAIINAKQSFSTGYKQAISQDSNISDEACRTQLLADYNFVLETFEDELNSDYESAKDSFTEEPYKSTGKFDEIVSFMYIEGFVDIEYENVAGSGIDKTKIKEVKPQYNESIVKDKESAIKYVFDSKIAGELNMILSYYATATTVRTDYIAKATEIILHEGLADGELRTKSIEGIKSLGHDTDVNSVKIGEKDYAVAREYNDDGTVKNSNEYAVLRVEVNGVDPKAVWNLGFTVAPYHYYSNPSDPELKIDIKAKKFGVKWGSFDFMKNVVQGNNSNGVAKNQIPVGAGPYVATDDKDSDAPRGNAFNNNGSVYFKSNPNFLLGEAKIKHVTYQYVSSTNAIDVLKSGSVHFVTPQFTRENKQQLDALESKGYGQKSTWQLGYGYIGVNAGKVSDINARKAIMSAMNTTLALEFYTAGTAVNIAWPMSIVSWAYPRTTGNSFDSSDPLKNMEPNNGHEYMQFTTDEAAKAKINKYTQLAKNNGFNISTQIKFTIAGANLTEHPVYPVFVKAAELLKSCGWNIEVVPDNTALQKLATGSLTVWAAAWGSTNDPDMYQVYHKDSTATSVLSWGYREILANRRLYSTENDILTRLSERIDAGRKTDVESERTAIYKTAMGYVMDLAVELPVYQRTELYAYNSKVIDTSTFPKEINSYSSPLGKIWEIDFVK